MRKLFFGIVLSIAGLTACAQENKVVKGRVTEINVAQDKFSEIGPEELPVAVIKAIETYYPTAKINKAFVNNSQQFRLDLILKEGNRGTIYADKDGDWIER
ncbi:MAG: hypothetical protein R2814_06920 [Flavobacteriaceae bacterium]